MNYQVMLTNDIDEPLHSQPVALTFELWTTESGGVDPEWTETHNTETNAIGVVSVALGSSQSLGAVDFSQELWLQIIVNGAEMSPRRKLLSSPYACYSMDAASLGGVAASGYSLDGHDHDSDYVNEGQGNSVSTAMIVPDLVSSIDGVTNDGGDIDLVGGSNVTITPDDGANTITISASGGGDGDITAVYADNGLIGTATSGDANLSVGAGNGITVTADAVAVNYGDGLRMDSGALETDSQELAGNGLVPQDMHSVAVNPGPGIVVSSDQVRRDNSYSWTVSGSNMYSAVSGDIGIGTASPEARLDIERTTSGIGLQVEGVDHPGGLSGSFVEVVVGDLEVMFDALEISVGNGTTSNETYIECEHPTGIPPDVDFSLNFGGDAYADGNWNAGGADLAEMMVASSAASMLEPGDVLVIDPAMEMSVDKSTSARSRFVAGVYSTKPGFVCSEREWDDPGRARGDEVSMHTLETRASDFNEIPVGVVGVVPCKVSAENGPIRVGDLLVTSRTPGHAMRDDDPAVGTVLGKALETLESGTGMIKALITLQ
jgi:hypothetical protein